MPYRPPTQQPAKSIPTDLRVVMRDSRIYQWYTAENPRFRINSAVNDNLQLGQPGWRMSQYFSRAHCRHYKGLKALMTDMAALIRGTHNGTLDGDALSKAINNVNRHFESRHSGDLFDTEHGLRIWAANRVRRGTDGVVGSCACCGTLDVTYNLETNDSDDEFCVDCIDNDERLVRAYDNDQPYFRNDLNPVYTTRRRALENDPEFYIFSRDWLRRFNYDYTEQYGWVSQEAYEDLCNEGDLNDEDDESESNDDSDSYGRDPTANRIVCYHTSRAYVGHLPGFYDNDTTRLLMGIELEIEVDDDMNCDEAAYDIRAQLNGVRNYEPGVYCWTERDGSLNHGFEVVTGYGGLDVHEEHLLQLTDTSGMRSHDTTTCGLHVHLDRSNITALHAVKLVQFIHDRKHAAFMHAFARRKNSSYGKFANKDDAASCIVSRRRDSFSRPHPRYYREKSIINAVSTDRYEAVNFDTDDYKTLEFRLYRGTLYVPTIMATLEFTRMTYLFTMDTPIHSLNMDAFLNYINRPEHKLETRYLRQWLFKHGWAARVTYHANECAIPLAHQLERRFAA